MAVAIAAAALHSSQGDLPQTVAALLGSPAAPQRLSVHGRAFPYHRLHGSHAGVAEALTPRLERLLAKVLAEAGLDTAQRRGCALYLGSSSHEIGEDEQAWLAALAQDPAAVALAGRQQGDLARHLATRFALGGGDYTLSTACTSSANALLLAAEAIQAGDCQAAVVIAEETLNYTSLLGFDGLLLLAGENCHPFDRRRDGMLPGEGLAAVVLVAASALPEHAHWQGMQLLGGASACDPQGITGSSAVAMQAVMTQALQQVGLDGRRVTLIKAHGSGSQGNDAEEAEAMRRCFGQAMPPFTLLKGALGHSFGACGLLEMLALLGCLRTAQCPPAHGFAEPDPALGCVPLQTVQPFSGGVVMCNQFGFGGNNASLLWDCRE